MPRFPKLTERVDEAHNPANNLALAMAFSGVGIISTLMPMMLMALYLLRCAARGAATAISASPEVWRPGVQQSPLSFEAVSVSDANPLDH